MTDVKKILEPEGAVLNREQLEYIRWTLGVPEELEVEVEQSLPYYWEGAGYWLIYVSFLYQGECVAAVEADAVTGEPLKGFYHYSY